MNNYADSDYAINKYSEGIVYHFADGIVEITAEDYLRENPDKTEGDFLELKALSDEMYLEQDRADHSQSWKNVSIHGLGEADFCSAPSPEEVLVEQEERAATERQRREIAQQALETLTEVQRRRYLMYHADGLTLMEIAEIEVVKFQSIDESLVASEKKIKEFKKNS